MSEVDTLKKEPIFVEDLDSFVKLLFNWHETKVQTLEHVLDVPEGTEISLTLYSPEDKQNKAEKKLILSGDVHAAFVAGVTLGLMELGKLPFFTEQEELNEMVNH